MKKIYVAACFILLAACGGDHFKTDSVGVVVVDGYEIEVKRNRADSTIWEAMHKNAVKLRLAPGDPKAYARNIIAIERVSGCGVIRDTMTHHALLAATTAGVECM